MIEKAHSVKVAHSARFAFFEVEAHATHGAIQLIEQRQEPSRAVDHDFAAGREAKMHFEDAVSMRGATAA
uniref:hypothetical protein n=1 Tax=Methylomonas sp. PHL2-19 TaxID=3438878 RepID=UPI00402B447E